MKCIVRDIPLFYESYGTGTPIILLHGFSSDHRQMKGRMEPLFTQQHGWQRIYLDLPGMGQTPGNASIQGTDDILGVIVDFIDAVIPGQPFLLVGDSYGGYLSQGVPFIRDHLLSPPTRSSQRERDWEHMAPAQISTHAHHTVSGISLPTRDRAAPRKKSAARAPCTLTSRMSLTCAGTQGSTCAICHREHHASPTMPRDRAQIWPLRGPHDDWSGGRTSVPYQTERTCCLRETITRWRRLSRDHEGLPQSSEAFIKLSACRRMLSLLAPPFP